MILSLPIAESEHALPVAQDMYTLLNRARDPLDAFSSGGMVPYMARPSLDVWARTHATPPTATAQPGRLIAFASIPNGARALNDAQNPGVWSPVLVQ